VFGGEAVITEVAVFEGADNGLDAYGLTPLAPLVKELQAAF
jgi:hypothetical protein